jgi:hypothetical protein
MDDDVETDEEQLILSNRHVIKELGEGLRLYRKDVNNVRNKKFLKYKNN